MSTGMTREEIIECCETYIFKCLTEHKPELVPFAEDCTRTELGMNTGRNATHIREMLRNEMYNVIEDSFDLNWVVEGDQACVFYKQSTSIKDEPNLIATRFLVQDGLIKEIEILMFNEGMMDITAEAVKALSEG